VYRHSDGYPKSVLPALDHLQELLRVTGTQRNASYAAAQFILIDKLRRIKQGFRCQGDIYSDFPQSIPRILEPERWRNVEATPTYLLGHGVENPSNGIHGDEEFLYVVELSSRPPLDGSAEWRIKVSEHCGFPKWDEDGISQAFENADWQIQGTLQEALVEVGSDD
jgi:hypothetical protein